MTNLKKMLVSTAAVAAMTTVGAASPAMARDHDGIGAGEIIAGALVIGGIAAIAAIAASANNRSDDYRDIRYRDGYYNRRGNAYGYRDNARSAVNQCVAATERRVSYRNGRADVTEIRDIDRTRDGYRVKGRLAVQEYRGRYNRRGYDTGSFTCRVEYGRVTDLDIRGVR